MKMKVEVTEKGVKLARPYSMEEYLEEILLVLEQILAELKNLNKNRNL